MSIKPRILVVDDVPDNILILSDALAGPYTILAARNGEAALRIARSAPPPDLILLDIMMPGLDGFEVCSRLKADETLRDIPVIFITAAGELQSKTRGFALGAVDYITKPFEIEEVQARVRNHIALVEALRRLESQNRELVEAARLREDVERITRHDLKGPLSAIIGIPQMILLDETLGDERRQDLELIIDSGQKMLRMINLSLDLFRMERGLYQARAVEVDLVKLLADVRREYSSLARIAGSRVDILVRGEPAAQGQTYLALGEELLCYCLFSNLVKNALEATPEDSPVTASLEDAGPGRISLTVVNQGEVPPSIRSTFFDKYVTSGKQGGTGLGTYSARLVAQTLGGSIALDCARPGWTSLRVELPAPIDQRASTRSGGNRQWPA